MRHRVAGRQLSRTTSHRRALRRNMAASLIQHGAIRTTEPKAKELRRFVEKLITMARRGTLHARRLVIAELQDRAMTNDEGDFEEMTVVQKLFAEIAPRYADRAGGYTRIIRLSDRRIGDSGQQVVLQLVEQTPAEQAKVPTVTSRRRRRAAKRHQAAAIEAGEASDAAGGGEQAAEAAQPPAGPDDARPEEQNAD